MITPNDQLPLVRSSFDPVQEGNLILVSFRLDTISWIGVLNEVTCVDQDITMRDLIGVEGVAVGVTGHDKSGEVG